VGFAEMKIEKRKALIFLFLIVILPGGCIVLACMWKRPHTNDLCSLSLSLGRHSISRGDLFAGKLPATVEFRNNSERPIEFMTNGIDCFQFLDIAFVDDKGKNHAIGKYGDVYKVTAQAKKKQLLMPGESSKGTISIAQVVVSQPIQGTFYVQAFLQYQDISVASNVVELIVTP
jgi:hypothetical protein